MDRVSEHRVILRGYIGLTGGGETRAGLWRVGETGVTMVRGAGHGLAFLHPTCPPQFPSVDLQSALSTVTALRTPASEQGIRLTANEVRRRLSSGRPGLACPIPRSSCLLAQQSVRGPCLAGLGSVLQDAVYALNPQPTCGAVVLVARIPGSRNQSLEMRAPPLTVTRGDFLAAFLLPGPMT